MSADGAQPLNSAKEESGGQATKTELLAEVFGTFVLILGGTATVASFRQRAKDQEDSLGAVTSDTFSEALFINRGWALSVGAGVLVSFDASGAHLNPAVTLCAMVYDSFGIGKGLAYMLAQCVGALFGAILTGFLFTGFDNQYAMYGTAFYHTGPSPGTTSWVNAFFVELVGTALLLIGINFLANGDIKPNKLIMSAGLVALIAFIGTTVGYQTGYGLNPAREAMPRLVRLMQELFFGSDNAEVLDDITDWTSWVPPVFGPFAGALLGKLAWKVFRKPETSAAEEGVEMS